MQQTCNRNAIDDEIEQNTQAAMENQNRQFSNNYNQNYQNRGGSNNRQYNNNNNNNYNNNNRGNYQRRNYGNNYHNANTAGSSEKQERTPRPGEDRPKKEAIIDLAQYFNKKVEVKIMGRREVVGILKGYDQLMNLVLDDTVETVFLEEPTTTAKPRVRNLGRVVVRSTMLYEINPAEGVTSIDSPFTEVVPGVSVPTGPGSSVSA